MIDETIKKRMKLVNQICPKVEAHEIEHESVSKVLDTSLTPAALKKLSKSVMDLSTINEVTEISRTTTQLMTGSMLDKMIKKRKHLKSESKSSLLRSSADSLMSISDDVRVSWCRGKNILSLVIGACHKYMLSYEWHWLIYF